MYLFSYYNCAYSMLIFHRYHKNKQSFKNDQERSREGWEEGGRMPRTRSQPDREAVKVSYTGVRMVIGPKTKGR